MGDRTVDSNDGFAADSGPTHESLDPEIEAILDRVLDGDDVAQDLESLEPEIRHRVTAIIGAYGRFQGSIARGDYGRFFMSGAGPTPNEWIGATIGGCLLRRVLGEGGFGVVFEAEQERPRRLVAVKLLRQSLPNSALRRRFENEAESLARLGHRHIARVFASGVHEEGRLQVPYIVMELVHGAKSIVDHCQSSELPMAERIELVAKVCDAVQYGHWKGVIHRDIKPSNILIDSEGDPKVIDFGVARNIASTDATPRSVDRRETGAGELLGTRDYMSPEQMHGGARDVDARTDVYALGIVLYRLLTGAMPFTREDHYTHENGPSPHRDSLDLLRPASTIVPALRGDIDAIIWKALSVDREGRYPSASAFADDLRRHLAHLPVVARPAGIVRRIACFARRRQATFAAMVTVILVIVAAAVGVATAWRSATRALERERAVGKVLRIKTAEAALANGDFIEARRRLEELAGAPPRWELDHLWSQLQSIDSTLFATVGATVQCLAFDSAGHRIAVGTSEPLRKLTVYDERTQKVLFGYEAAPAAVVRCVAFDSTGERLIAAIGSNIVVFNAASNLFEVLWDAPVSRDRTPPPTITAMALAPSHSLLAVATHDSDRDCLHLVDFVEASNRPLRLKVRSFILPDYLKNVSALAMSPDGRSIAGATYDAPFMTFAWDIDVFDDLGREEAAVAPRPLELQRHDRRVHAAAFLPSGRLATARADGLVQIDPIVEPRLSSESKDSIDSVRVSAASAQTVSVQTPLQALVCFDKSGALAMGGGDRRLWIWSPNPEMIGAELPLTSFRGHARELTCIAASATGEIATGSKDGTVRVWRLALRKTAVLGKHASSVAALNVLGPGRIATAAGDRSGVKIWDLVSNSLIAKIPLDDVDEPLGIGSSPEGEVMFVVTYSLGTLTPRLHRFALAKASGSASAQGAWSIEDAPKVCLSGIDVTETGERLSFVDGAGRVRVLCMAADSSASPRSLVDRPIEGAVAAVFLDKEGHYLAVGGSDIQWIDVSSQQSLGHVAIPNTRASRLALSHDRDLLAVGCEDGSIRLFDVLPDAKGLRAKGQLIGHTAMITGIAFHPREPRLFSAAVDGMVKVWDTEQYEAVLTAREQSSPIRHLAFDPRTERLVVSSAGFLGVGNQCTVFDRFFDPK